MHGWTLGIERKANIADYGIEDLLHMSYEATESSRSYGRLYVQRAFARTEGADRPHAPRSRAPSTTRSSSGHP